MIEAPFYVGWQERAPRPLGRFLARTAVAAALGGAAVAALLAAFQAPQPGGVFEYGVQRTFRGVLYATPVPSLRVPLPAERDGAPAGATFLLVGKAKHGMPESALRLDGRVVRFRGSLIRANGLAMIEMNDPASIVDLGVPKPAERRGANERLGAAVLVGELVDTKCYLGVMRPATGKIHRACAVRCLAGGVPPAILVRGAGGATEVVPMAGPDGRPLALDPQLGGTEIEARGEIELRDGVAVLRAVSVRSTGP